MSAPFDRGLVDAAVLVGRGDLVREASEGWSAHFGEADPAARRLDALVEVPVDVRQRWADGHTDTLQWAGALRATGIPVRVRWRGEADGAWQALVTDERPAHAEAEAQLADDAALDAFAQSLGGLDTFQALSDRINEEVSTRTAYISSWMYLFPEEDAKVCKLFAASRAGDVLQSAVAEAPVEGDRMLEAVLEGSGPLVIVDARTDPRTNKALVEASGARTMVQIPLRLMDRRVGIFGVGTIAPRDPRPPTARELHHLTRMGPHVAVAASRLLYAEKEAQAEREAAALRAQVEHAQKLESLGVMASGIAHDLSNLMQVVLGNTQLALDAPETDADREPLLLDIEAAATQAAELSQQMLTLSGHSSAAMEAVGMGRLFADTQRLLRAAVPRNITLEIEDRCGEARIRGVPSQLRQVFLNLVGNAADAIGTRAGRIRVALDVAHPTAPTPGFLPAAAPAGPQVVLRVEDDGGGMDERTQRRIFEPFFTTKATGRGLGMAIVLGVVKSHGGVVRLDSRPGEGTTFEIRWPQTDQVAAPRATAAEPRGDARAAHLLVVDDEPMVRALMRRALEKSGWSVEVADRARAGLDKLRDAPDRYRGVVMDLTMPDMGGKAALAEIRALAPSLPVLLASGYSAEQVSDELTRDPCLAFLQKPFSTRDLVAQVGALMGASPARAS